MAGSIWLSAYYNPYINNQKQLNYGKLFKKRKETEQVVTG